MYSREYKERWRFAESYTDPFTGRKREVSVVLDKNTTASRKEAMAILQEKIRERTTAAHPELIRFGELVNKFIKYQYQMRKESTAKQDETVLQGLSKLIGSDALVTKITAPLIKEKLDGTGKGNTWKNTKIKHVKKLFRWAYKQGYVPDLTVPDRLERYPEKSARQKVIGKYLESDELHDLIESMCSHPEYQLLTKFLVLSGCRIGEAFALILNDVDMINHTITVNKTYSLNTHKVQSTKTETSERTIYMRPELLELTRSLLLRQKQMCLVYGMRSNLLLPWKDGGHMHYDAYRKFFRKHVLKVHGTSLPVHSLRHTYTSLMAEAGIPIETISRQLGHGESSITKQIYTHVTDKVREADNKKLDAVNIL